MKLRCLFRGHRYPIRKNTMSSEGLWLEERAVTNSTCVHCGYLNRVRLLDEVSDFVHYGSDKEKSK